MTFARVVCCSVPDRIQLTTTTRRADPCVLFRGSCWCSKTCRRNVSRGFEEPRWALDQRSVNRPVTLDLARSRSVPRPSVRRSATIGDARPLCRPVSLGTPDAADRNATGSAARVLSRRRSSSVVVGRRRSSSVVVGRRRSSSVVVGRRARPELADATTTFFVLDEEPSEGWKVAFHFQQVTRCPSLGLLPSCGLCHQRPGM